MLYPLLFLGMFLGMCGSIAWQTVRPRTGRLSSTPGIEHLPFSNVRFVSEDGTHLAGWFIAAESPRGVIVLCHGVDSDRTAMLVKARMLYKHGYSSLLFDFRGRGESDPSLCTIGYREVDDLLAAVRFVKGREDCKGLPLGVLGESQGGAVALMGTARCPEIAAVVAESAFAELDHAVVNHFRKVFGWAAPAVAFPTKWIGQAIIRHRCCDIAPVNEIARIAPRTILLIQDAGDSLCPSCEGADLLKAAGANASLWTVPDADHVCAEMVAPEEFEKRVVAFFDHAFDSRTSAVAHPDITPSGSPQH